METAIINKTRKKTLFERPRYATTPLQQAQGLMFRKPGPQDGIVFLFLPARRVRFHMLFVFGPIDILALDGTGKVVALKERFCPFTFWSPGVSASAVIELPAGRIAQTGTRLGDAISLPPQNAAKTPRAP